MRGQFADDFVIFSGRGARHPADLESSAIGALLHVEAFAVDIEDRKSRSKRFGEGFPARHPRGLVELTATEIVSGSHA